MPFLTPVLVGRVPLLKKTTEKKGSLMLTSLLENLVVVFLVSLLFVSPAKSKRSAGGRSLAKLLGGCLRQIQEAENPW